MKKHYNQEIHKSNQSIDIFELLSLTIYFILIVLLVNKVIHYFTLNSPLEGLLIPLTPIYLYHS